MWGAILNSPPRIFDESIFPTTPKPTLLIITNTHINTYTYTQHICTLSCITRNKCTHVRTLRFYRIALAGPLLHDLETLLALYILNTLQHLTSYFLRLTSYFLHLTSYFLFLTSYYLITSYFLLLTTYLLLTSYFLHLTSYFLLLTTYLLLTSYFLLLTSYFLHLTTYFLLLTSYYLLLTL